MANKANKTQLWELEVGLRFKAKVESINTTMLTTKERVGPEEQTNNIEQRAQPSNIKKTSFSAFYREDMQKVNVKFHENNYTVSYQHKKILQFVPELSIDKDTPITTPNIPLLVRILSNNLSVKLVMQKEKPYKVQSNISFDVA